MLPRVTAKKKKLQKISKQNFSVKLKKYTIKFKEETKSFRS